MCRVKIINVEFKINQGQIPWARPSDLLPIRSAIIGFMCFITDNIKIPNTRLSSKPLIDVWC